MLRPASRPTLARLLGPARASYPRRRAATTHPSSWLKPQIPIRTVADWDDARPGFCQIDLVAHCGGSTRGFYLPTLCAVDVASRGVERQALWGKGRYRVAAGVQAVRERRPVPLTGLDSDNGSEFINRVLSSSLISALAFSSQYVIPISRYIVVAVVRLVSPRYDGSHILDLSKIEAGRMELELSDFHLPLAIENALTLVRERAGRRGIAMGHTLDERLSEIRGDERKIKQVLLNLLSNAIKFTPEGGRIEVAAVSKDGLAEVSVSDTGVGIAPEDQEKVFEEFRQVGTAEKKAEGTGLGLTLCRKFIELHGGRIWVKSQVGAGSTFAFTVPVRRD